MGNSNNKSIKNIDKIQVNVQEFNLKKKEQIKNFKKYRGIDAYDDIVASDKNHYLKEYRDTDYELTQNELNELTKNKYLVKNIDTNNDSYWNKYQEIYNNNMPILLSVDSVFFLFNEYFNSWLEDLEKYKLNEILKNACVNIHKKINEHILLEKNNNTRKILESILDVFDVCICIFDNSINNTTLNIFNKKSFKYMLREICISYDGNMFEMDEKYNNNKSYFLIFNFLNNFKFKIRNKDDFFIASVMSILCKNDFDEYKNIIKNIIDVEDDINICSLFNYLLKHFSNVPESNYLEHLLENIEYIYRMYPSKNKVFGIINSITFIDQNILSLMVGKYLQQDDKNDVGSLRKHPHIYDLMYVLFNNHDAKKELILKMAKKETSRDGYWYSNDLEIKNTFVQANFKANSLYKKQIYSLKMLSRQENNNMTKKYLSSQLAGYCEIKNHNVEKSEPNVQPNLQYNDQDVMIEPQMEFYKYLKNIVTEAINIYDNKYFTVFDIFLDYVIIYLNKIMNNEKTNLEIEKKFKYIILKNFRKISNVAQKTITYYQNDETKLNIGIGEINTMYFLHNNKIYLGPVASVYECTLNINTDMSNKRWCEEYSFYNKIT